MELKRVEMIGFKSFPEKVVIEFDKGVTAIVGPNGSGKSNIADAVRWVLGEQSARMLRGSKMEDVIFAGTERRRPVNFASVTLILDNSDRKMAVDYDEVAISRKVYRSGESEYAINEGRCRLRDVQELLMDTGIGKEGYSIIGQGQIDRLLSDKPAERRLVFEEAAGIVKYKSRKEEAEKKLEGEEENLSRLNDILTELTARIDPLTADAAKAEEFLKLRDELKTYEVTAFLGQYKQLGEQYEKAEKNLSDLLAQLESAKEREHEARAQADLYKNEAAEAQNEYRELNESHHSLELSYSQKEGDITLREAELSQKKKEEERVTGLLADAKEKVHSQLETIGREEKHADSLEEKLSAKEAERQEAEALLGEKNEALSKLRAAWDEALGALETLRGEGTELKTQNERALTALEFDRSQQEGLSEQEQALSAELETLSGEVAAKEADCAAAEKEWKDLGARISALNTEINDLRQNVREKQQELAAKVDALRETQNRVKWLNDLEKDYEGFSGSVKSVMARRAAEPALARKVRGTVADLISVPAKLSVAMEIALGANLQNVVTEDEATAKELIEFLRKEQKGRATFMPLDRVTGREDRPEKKAVKKMSGVLAYDDELIGYGSEYSEIVSRLLGNVAVTEDFDSASAVARAYGSDLRVVTLKGDIFNIGGSITGGSTMKAGNILSRKSELDGLAGLLEQQQKEADAAKADADALTAARQAKNAELEEKSAAYDEKRQAAQEQKNALTALTVRRDELAGRLGVTRESAETSSRSRKEHEDFLASFAERLAAQQQAEEKAAEAAANAQAAYEAGTEALGSAKNAETELRIAAKGIEQELLFTRRNVERERESIREISDLADGYLAELEELARAQQELAAGKETLTVELEALKGQIEAAGERTESMDKVLSEKNARWEESMKAANGILAEIGALEKDELRLENQQARAKKDLEDLQERIWEEYQLTYRAALSLECPDLGSPAAMKRRIGELKEQIRSLGPVNVNAITELTALTDRVELLTTQRDDVVRSEESLREIITQLETQMEKQFAESFRKINGFFEETFRGLFGGGHAQLRLTTDENTLEAGVEIAAQPPGKTLQSMTLLSGGERALTAIALLFAIQQLSPAPFCILDEIEAALDEVNVARFAHYLGNLCNDTQYIVITHRKGTMEAADTMYGVTMEEKGVSKCVSVKLE